jgi:hypothetical protein
LGPARRRSLAALLGALVASAGLGAAPPKSSETWWAYRELARPKVPPVKGAAWVRSPIDAFILAKVEARGLSPVPAASRAALARRACFDLTGLPPSPEEVDAFAADASPEAYERLVDRLLSSPRYGEKWGRHWLDLVRYAETNGYERDGAKPQAWRYRDYVIRSFNADKPYDRLIQEQIAGDELEPLTSDSIIATGYYRLGLWDDEAADKEQARFDELDDILATTAQAFLGTTINCARCHEHKADPIPQADYYRMLAFFQDIPRYGSEQHILTDITDLSRLPEENARTAALFGRKAAVSGQIAAIEAAAIVKMSVEDQRKTEGPEREKVLAVKLADYLTQEAKDRHRELKGELAELEGKLSRARVLALSVNHCETAPPATHVLFRGSAHAPGEEVQPGFPRALAKQDPVILPSTQGARSSGRRKVFADWVASPQNPLAARVIANRLWQHHFGRGLVRSPNDFGKLGELPTHPELLDWLASEIIDRGWSLKAMHKLIMTSSAFRMSSGEDPEGLAKDPANDLFWRFDMKRLSAEEIRDTVLTVNGSLNLSMGGPSVYTEVPKAVLQTASQPGNAWGTSPPAERDRRSVYIFIKRSLIEPVLGMFDLADPDASCAARFSTTVPTQALTSLNGDFFIVEARRFASRLLREAGTDPAARVRLALRLALTREPNAREVARNVSWLESLERDEGLSRESALEQFCLMVLNLNEFVYLD